MKSRLVVVVVVVVVKGGGGIRRRSQHSACKLKELHCRPQPAEPNRPVTFPGAHQQVWVGGDGLALSDDWALVGHKERHRLPHLMAEERNNKNRHVRTQATFTYRKIKIDFFVTLHVCANLCSVDKPPSVQEAKAVLVAVMETSSIQPPVSTEVTL